MGSRKAVPSEPRLWHGSPGDDFAANFYLNLLPEAEQPVLVLATLSKLALEYRQSGKWADALPLLIEIMDFKKATLGPLLARRDLAQPHIV